LPKRSPPASRPLPSKEEVAAYIAEAPRKVGKREIARAFGLQGDDRIWLKDILRELEAEGAVGRRRRALHKAGGLPPVVLADVCARDRDGELVAEPAEWDAEEHGPAPKIVVAMPRKPRPGQPAPGLGDRVLLRVERARDGGAERYTGRVVKVIDRQKAQVLGVFRGLPDGSGRIVPVAKKAQGRELLVAPSETGGAKDGDLVTATVVRQGRFGLPQAKIRERLGSLQSEKAVSLIAIYAHQIPHVFPAEVLAEAERAVPATTAEREDWRD
jgi:ribonuclease R